MAGPVPPIKMAMSLAQVAQRVSGTVARRAQPQLLAGGPLAVVAVVRACAMVAPAQARLIQRVALAVQLDSHKTAPLIKMANPAI